MEKYRQIIVGKIETKRSYISAKIETKKKPICAIRNELFNMEAFAFTFVRKVVRMEDMDENYEWFLSSGELAAYWWH